MGFSTYPLVPSVELLDLLLFIAQNEVVLMLSTVQMFGVFLLQFFPTFIFQVCTCTLPLIYINIVCLELFLPDGPTKLMKQDKWKIWFVLCHWYLTTDCYLLKKLVYWLFSCFFFSIYSVLTTVIGTSNPSDEVTPPEPQMEKCSLMTQDEDIRVTVMRVFWVKGSKSGVSDWPLLMLSLKHYTQ